MWIRLDWIGGCMRNGGQRALVWIWQFCKGLGCVCVCGCVGVKGRKSV